MRHRRFTLVLAGGGTRGYAHVGVLRALEHMGLAPSGIAGVSMGAVVGATYALRDDWYTALIGGGARRRAGIGFRLETADVVLPPVFDRFVEVLDFGARRHCVAAGWSVTREHRTEIERTLSA